MDWTSWSDFVQSVVLLSTLLIVIWQLRQAERATRRDAVLRAMEDHDRLNDILLERPKLISFMGPPGGGYADWSPDEVDFMTFLTLALGRFERLHALRREGYVPDDLWETWVVWVRDIWFGNEISMRIWQMEGPFYSSSFQLFINELLLTKRPVHLSAPTPTIASGRQARVWQPGSAPDMSERSE